MSLRDRIAQTLHATVTRRQFDPIPVTSRMLEVHWSKAGRRQNFYLQADAIVALLQTEGLVFPSDVEDPCPRCGGDHDRIDSREPCPVPETAS